MTSFYGCVQINDDADADDDEIMTVRRQYNDISSAKNYYSH